MGFNYGSRLFLYKTEKINWDCRIAIVAFTYSAMCHEIDAPTDGQTTYASMTTSFFVYSNQFRSFSSIFYFLLAKIQRSAQVSSPEFLFRIRKKNPLKLEIQIQLDRPN